jgi:hypothetical protein
MISHCQSLRPQAGLVLVRERRAREVAGRGAEECLAGRARLAASVAQARREAREARQQVRHEVWAKMDRLSGAKGGGWVAHLLWFFTIFLCAGDGAGVQSWVLT